LFACAVLLLIATDQTRKFNSFQQMLPQNRNVELLLELVKENAKTAPLYEWFDKALKGKFTSTQHAIALWRKLVLDRRIRKPREPGVAAPWLKVVFTASIVLCLATIFYFWKK
jgi:serine/threonine-protein kinase